MGIRANIGQNLNHQVALKIAQSFFTLALVQYVKTGEIRPLVRYLIQNRLEKRLTTVAASIFCWANFSSSLGHKESKSFAAKPKSFWNFCVDALITIRNFRTNPFLIKKNYFLISIKKNSTQNRQKYWKFPNSLQQLLQSLIWNLPALILPKVISYSWKI